MGSRMVGAALRCYPARWRQRHGDDAAELAAQLIDDGAPAICIALSYLTGAARSRLTPGPGRRLRRTACAVLIAACSLGVPAELIVSSMPARAASTAHARQAMRPAPQRQHVITGRAGHDESR